MLCYYDDIDMNAHLRDGQLQHLSDRSEYPWVERQLIERRRIEREVVHAIELWLLLDHAAAHAVLLLLLLRVVGEDA